MLSLPKPLPEILKLALNGILLGNGCRNPCEEFVVDKPTKP